MKVRTGRGSGERPAHRWVIVVRAVGDDATPGVQGVYADDVGTLPNDEQQERLREHVRGLYRERWGVEPERVALAVLPCMAEDGEVVSWRRVLRLG